MRKTRIFFTHAITARAGGIRGGDRLHARLRRRASRFIIGRRSARPDRRHLQRHMRSSWYGSAAIRSSHAATFECTLIREDVAGPWRELGYLLVRDQVGERRVGAGEERIGRQPFSSVLSAPGHSFWRARCHLRRISRPCPAARAARRSRRPAGACRRGASDKRRRRARGRRATPDRGRSTRALRRGIGELQRSQPP